MAILVANPPRRPGDLVPGADPQIGGGFGGKLVVNMMPAVAKIATVFGALEIEGYRESWTRDGQQGCTRYFNVPWQQRGSWKDFVLGYSVTLNVSTDPDNPRYLISREIPCQDPEFPRLYAHAARLIKGNGVMIDNPALLPLAKKIAYINPQPAAFDTFGGDGYAGYECTFTNYPYRIRIDQDLRIDVANPVIPNNKGELERYIIRNKRYCIQSIPLPAGQVKFTAGPSAGQPIPANAAYILNSTQDLSYEWVEVPDVPEAAIDDCAGGVNDKTFDGARGYRSYAVGTLLCQAPPRVEEYSAPNGCWYRRVVYSFLYRPAGWSKLPDKNGVYQPVAFPDGSPLYPLKNFNALFQAVAPLAYD